jgi:sortase A
MKMRRWAANGLLLAGLLAIGIWAWSNAARFLSQARQSWVFDHELRRLPATFDQFLMEEKDWLTRLLQGPNLRKMASPPPAPASTPMQPSPRDQNLIGRLTIPRLHLSAMVREGDGEDTLRVALGHIPGTALPGATGNIGVAGHRDTFFRALREIRQNDLIRLQSLAGTYVYRVDLTEIVTPGNVSVLRAGRQPELTLVTCYPFYYVGAAPGRFIVKARQVSALGAVAPSAATTPDSSRPYRPTHRGLRYRSSAWQKATFR